IFQLQWACLLDWKRQYVEPDVMDGTNWQVELVRDGRNIYKQGNNKFPRGWEELCHAIKELTGQEFS
ncbi:hypothetical protein, partial [Pseudomonas sp. 2822-17]|uniref:hypothetical protein n=1 Tax=Pseudomonas sp. 2822-17 TaxID=1712678 RepID=UPI001C43CE4E